MIGTKLKKYIFLIFTFVTIVLLNSCVVGPDYHRPTIPVPTAYKESKGQNWKVAKPADLANHKQWWLVFNSPTLNSLESQVNISNQNVAVAAAQYQQALAVVEEARASYFPTLSASASVTQQTVSNTGNASGNQTGSGGGGNNNFNQIGSTRTDQYALTASWVPDIWGSIRRTVEANRSAAEASAAQLAGARLSAQTSLAQYYFELRGVDSDQKLLTQTVIADKKILALTKNLFKEGVDSMVDIAAARSQLETAQASLINLGVNRGQFEHAIAVLIGKAPAELSLPYHPFFGTPPTIPTELPSELLERRPDIAAAERNMQQANAQIGVAIAAYFPSLTIAPTAMVQYFNSLYDAPIYSWSIGPAIAQTLFDGGLRSATTAAARANYNAVVAQYRQTVLAAFQNVEDNLVSVRVLKQQAIAQNKAAKNAELSLALTVNQYKSGTASYPNVLTAQVNAYTAEKNAVDVTTLRMTSSVGLISALGGGWHT